MQLDTHMKDKTVSVYGVPLTIPVPETVEEYTACAGDRGPDAVVEDAVNNTWYRGGANDAREALYAGLLALKGIKRPTETTDAGKTVQAPPTRSNIMKLLDDDESLEDLGEGILADWVKGYKFDASAAERGGGAALTVTKAVEKLRDKMIAELGEDGAAEKVGAALTAKGIDYTVEATAVSITTALAKLDKLRRDKEREAKKKAQEDFMAAFE